MGNIKVQLHTLCHLEIFTGKDLVNTSLVSLEPRTSNARGVGPLHLRYIMWVFSVNFHMVPLMYSPLFLRGLFVTSTLGETFQNMPILSLGGSLSQISSSHLNFTSPFLAQNGNVPNTPKNRD